MTESATTSSPSPLPKLVRIVDLAALRAADPWSILDERLHKGEAVFTKLPEGRYFTYYTRRGYDPFEARETVLSVDPEVWLDLQGLVGLQAHDLQEMARRRDDVEVHRVMAVWGDVETVDVGGPLLVTVASLLVPGSGERMPARRSVRDAERLALGADALLTVRRAAELVPGDDRTNRQIILQAAIVCDHGGRKLVRWGDVLSLFPTASEQVEITRIDREREIQRDLDTQPRRRKPRRRNGAVRLADL
jgi:hypothetical protein